MAQQPHVDFTLEDVNLSDVDAWGGEYALPPQGDFMLTVVHMEKKPSSKQQPMIAVTFEIADEGEHLGKKVFNNYSLQQKALGRLKALSVACGAQLDRFDSSQHIGQTIRGTIIHVDGQPGVDDQGNPRPAKTFANVINEQPLEEATEAVQETAPAKPPVMRNQQTPPPAKNKATNGAPRRA